MTRCAYLSRIFRRRFCGFSGAVVGHHGYRCHRCWRRGLWLHDLAVVRARDVATIEHGRGRPRHGRLGIRGSDAQSGFLPPSHSAGVLVQSVDSGGPAAAVGLQVGDVVVELNGAPLLTWELIVDARMLEPGDEAFFESIRKVDV